MLTRVDQTRCGPPRRTSWLFGAVIVVLFFGSVLGQGTTTSGKKSQIPPLERETDGRNLSSIEVPTLFAESLGSTSVPGGIVELLSSVEKPRLDFEPKSLRLKDVLDSIVSTEPRYQWKEDRGVINLLPDTDHPLLSVRIKNFEATNATKEEMLASLQQKEEFLAAVGTLGIQPEPLLCCGGPCTDTPPRNSLKLQNASVHEILNEIVRLNKRSVWLYRESSPKTGAGDQKTYYKIRFIVDYGRACDAPKDEN